MADTRVSVMGRRGGLRAGRPGAGNGSSRSVPPRPRGILIRQGINILHDVRWPIAAD